MASRKRLRPVAAPVDPFVTPANPGPEQSNQTWDGLLQLSSSLFQADAAYRAADERKKQEARVAKAEEREQRREADKYAPIALEVLNSLPKADRDLYKSGAAPEELKLHVAGLLHEAGIPDASNPQTLQSLIRFEVARLPEATGYATLMEEPGFLESIATLPPDQQQAAFAERKQAYIADLVGSGRLTQAQVPLLMGSLRVLDDERNASMARRRDRQFDAKTNTLLADAAKTLTDAMSMGEEEQQVAALKNAKSLMATLSATRKDVARTKLLGVVKDTMVTRIEKGDLSEGDALEELSAIQDAGLLDGEQQVDLERIVANALSQQERKAQDPIRSAQVNRNVQGVLAQAIFEQQQQNGGEPLTEEQLSTVVNSRLDEIKGIYFKADLSENEAYSALQVAKERARRDQEARRSDDRDLVVSLDTMVDQLSPDAIENINQAYVDKKITRETRNRLLDEVERSTDPEQVSSRVSRFLQRQAIPGGIQPSDLQRDLEQVFATTPGTAAEKSTALRERYQSAISDLLETQTDSLRTDKPFYWLAEGRSGRSGAIRSVLNDTVKSYIDQYAVEESDELFSDVLSYIFDGLSDSERSNFRSLPENQQAIQLTRYAFQLRETKPRQALEAYLKEKRAAKQTAAIRQKITGQQEALTEGKAIAGIGQLNIRDASREALAAVGQPSGFFNSIIYGRDRYTDAAHQVISRFSELEVGGDMSSRLPTGFELRYHDSVYVRALAKFAGVTDGIKIPDFNEFPDADSAKKYLRLHTLNYGVPLESLSTGRHLGLDLAEMKLTWDSSPYFESLQDLQSHISKNKEGQWELSEQAAGAFRFFKLNTEQETIQRFYNAQAKMTADRPEEQEFLKRMRTPDLSALRTEGGLIKFRGANILEDEFRSAVMEAK